METGTNYGYVRCSSQMQNDDRQVFALWDAGITSDRMFIDFKTGKDFDRPSWLKLVDTLREGDTLMVQSIDRLGRNYSEILEVWRYITKEVGAAIVVLDMPLLDTRQSRDLTGTLIADIVLQLLSYVAESERSLIRSRCIQGIEAAKKRGVRFGAPPKEQPPAFESALAEWMRGDLSVRQAGERCGVSHTTFLRWARRAVES